MKIQHKRGDDFQYNAEASEVDAKGKSTGPLDLTGATVRCQMRSTAGALVQEFAVAVTAPLLGKYALSATALQSQAWPVGTHNADVEYVIDGVKISTVTFQIQVVQDETYD